MGAGYDGQIRVDTSIDTAGFNSGTQNIGKNVNGIKTPLTALGSLLKSIGVAFRAIGLPGIGIEFTHLGQVLMASGKSMNVLKEATDSESASMGILSAIATIAGDALIAALFIATLGVIALIATVGFSISSFMKLQGSAQDLKYSFTDLKNAFAVAFAPLVTFAIPYIQLAIAWLVKLFNTIAMIVGALLGQKEVYQAVAGGSEQAAVAAEKQAKSTEKAKKAAEGILAAFDKLDVLKQPVDTTAAANPAGAAGTPAALGTAAFKMVPITNDILDKVNSVKKLFADIFAMFSDPLMWQKVWKGVQLYWEDFKNWMANIAWPWLVKAAQDTWAWVAQAASDAWAWIRQAWKDANAWYKTNVTVPIANWFKVAWDNIKTFASNAWQWIMGVWNIAANWFQSTVIDPIKGAFQTVLSWLGGAWNTVFSGIGSFVLGIVNSSIGYLNSLGQAAVKAVNAVITAFNNLPLLPDLAGLSWTNISTVSNSTGSSGFSGFQNFKGLATGAVIPPNAAFAAILGDQRSGTNIEAPADLIRQIVREEIGQGAQRITIDFGNSSLAALIRTLNPIIKQENDRKGTSLISGVTS
jgi:hypothetical protein